MDKNKFSKYCTILVVDDDNHSKIFISEKKISTTLDMVIIGQYE